MAERKEVLLAEKMVDMLGHVSDSKRDSKLAVEKDYF